MAIIQQPLLILISLNGRDTRRGHRPPAVSGRGVKACGVAFRNLPAAIDTKVNSAAQARRPSR